MGKDNDGDIPSVLFVKQMIQAGAGTTANGTAAKKDVGTGVGDVPIIGSNGLLASSIIPSIIGLKAGNLSLNAHSGNFTIHHGAGYRWVLVVTVRRISNRVVLQEMLKTAGTNSTYFTKSYTADSMVWVAFK